MSTTAVCLCIGSLCLADCVRASEVYVSPTGSDDNPGTMASPLATLARARDLVRASGKLGKEPVTVHVAAGVYYLPDTLVFTAADSGTKQAPVLYQGAGDGETVLSGGSKLDFAWS
ncbi:MAG: signaling protein, partial [Chloroflexi bacterium]|nr:signaling protein [Chloroflexota bacterium]